MRSGLLPAFAAVFCWITNIAMAQGLQGFDLIYDEPTKVNLGGRPVVADIALYTDQKKRRMASFSWRLLRTSQNLSLKPKATLRTGLRPTRNDAASAGMRERPSLNFHRAASDLPSILSLRSGTAAGTARANRDAWPKERDASMLPSSHIYRTVIYKRASKISALMSAEASRKFCRWSL